MADGALLGTQFIRVMADTAPYDAAISTTEAKSVQAGTAMEGAFAKVNPVLASMAGSTSVADAAVDKLNTSIQVSILKQQLATATREKDTAAMEMYAAALDQITADTAIAAGANEVLARSLQQLAVQERMAAVAAEEAAAIRETNMGALEKLGEGLGLKTMGAGVAMAAAAAAVAVFEIGKNAVESANHLEHLSQQLGISTESLSRWEYAGKTVGISVDDISRAVGLLARQMVKGTDEAGKVSTGLSNLGLSAVDAHGKLKSTDEMLGEIAEHFKTMPDGPLKTAAAMEIFGRSGKQMIPLLNLGKEGLDELREAADRAGYTLSEETAKAAHELTVQVEQMKLGLSGMARTIMGDVVPALVVLTANTSASSKASRELVDDDSLVHYFFRLKPFLVATASGFKDIAAMEVLAIKLATDLSTHNPFTTNIPARLKKDLAEYEKTIANIGQAGVLALEGPAENPNLKQGAEQITEHTEAVDKLNRSLQVNILQQRLKNAEDADNIPLQESLSAAIRAVTNYDDLQAGADKNLVAINETMAAAIEHRTLMTAAATEATKQQKEADEAAKKAAGEHAEMIKEVNAFVADTLRVGAERQKEENTLQDRFEQFMLASQARMTAATLTAKAAEIAAAEAAHQKRMLEISAEEKALDDAGKLTPERETQFNLERAQSARELTVQRLRAEEKYADGVVSILHRLIVEQAQAKDQMIHYAEQAAGQMTSSMSDVFFDVMTGKFNDLGKVAKNFLTQLLRDITNFLAEQATKKLLQLAFDFATTHGRGASTATANGWSTDPLSGYGTGLAIALPPPSSSSIAIPPSFSAKSTSYGPMPSPSSSRSGTRDDRLHITWEPGLHAALISSAADAGYGQAVNDMKRGGPLYVMSRQAVGLR